MPSQAQEVLVTDSAGVTLVRIPEPERVPPRWRLGSRHELGVTSPQPPDPLFRLTSAMRLSDGRALTASSSSSALIVFGSDGQYLGRIGRRGRGPGEFHVPILTRDYASDSVLVHDTDLSRLSFFDTSGHYSRSFLILGPNSRGMLVRSAVVGRGVDGTVIIRSGASHTPTTTGMSRTTDTFVRYVRGTERTQIDTIVELPGSEVIYSRVRGQPVFSALPFLRKSVSTFDGRHLYHSPSDVLASVSTT
jgi:hypothetical protein